MIISIENLFCNSSSYRLEPSLCDYEKQILLLNDYESISRWEQRTMAIVRRYADEQRQRLRLSRPVLTTN